MNTKFSSFALDSIKCPINILQELLSIFNRTEKCKAAILSWFDGRHYYNYGWIRVTYDYLAEQLGYCRETISKHMKALLEDGLLVMADREERRNLSSFPKDTANFYKLDPLKVADVVASKSGVSIKPNTTQNSERCEKPDIYTSDNSHISANNVSTYINSFKNTLNQQQPAVENRNFLEERQEISTDAVSELKDDCSSDQPVTSQIELPDQEFPEVNWDAIKMSVEAEQSTYMNECAYEELEANTTQIDPIFHLAPQIRLFTIARLALDLKQIIESVKPDTHEDEFPAPVQVKEKTSCQAGDSEELPDPEALKAAYAELRELKCDFRLNIEIQRAIARNFKNFPQAISLLKKRIFENDPPNKTWEALFMWKLKKGATDGDAVIVPTNFSKWYSWAYANGFVEQSEQRSDGVIGVCLRESVAISQGVNQWMRFDAAVELLGGPE